jgi:hypothetical protein
MLISAPSMNDSPVNFDNSTFASLHAAIASCNSFSFLA